MERRYYAVWMLNFTKNIWRNWVGLAWRRGDYGAIIAVLKGYHRKEEIDLFSIKSKGSTRTNGLKFFQTFLTILTMRAIKQWNSLPPVIIQSLKTIALKSIVTTVKKHNFNWKKKSYMFLLIPNSSLKETCLSWSAVGELWISIGNGEVLEKACFHTLPSLACQEESTQSFPSQAVQTRWIHELE